MKNSLSKTLRLRVSAGFLFLAVKAFADPGSGTAVPVSATTGTANYAKTSGTASYANTSGTAASLTGTIPASQVSGTVAQSGTASYAAQSGTASYTNTSGTAASLTGTIPASQVSGTVAQSGTASYAAQSGTASYTNTSGTAAALSGTIPGSQVSGTLSGLTFNGGTFAGTITRTGTLSGGTVSNAAIAGGTASNLALAGTNGALQQIADTQFGYNYSGVSKTGTSVVNIIYNEDMGTDADQAGSLAGLFDAKQKKLANVLAITVTGTTTWLAAATNAICTYYGYPDIPIGVQETGTFEGQNYYGTTIAQYPNSYLNSSAGFIPATATSVARRALASAPDNSVTYIYAGVMTNLYNLWYSAADSTSALTGSNLILQKVKNFVIMGGDYPTGHEYNFISDPTSTQVINQMQGVPITFIGYTLGTMVSEGNFWHSVAGVNPIQYAYSTQSNSRPTWNSMAVMYGVYGPSFDGTTCFATGSNGYDTVNVGGSNTWVSGTGPQQYLVASSTSAINSALFNILAANPSKSPFLTTNAATGYYQWAGNTLAVGPSLTGSGVSATGGGAVASGTGNFSNQVRTPQYVGTGSPPSIVTGAGIGTSGSATIVGTNTAGVITLYSGTTPTASAVITTSTYGGSYTWPTNSVVVLQPESATDTALTVPPYVTTTGSTFTINSGATGITGSTTYVYGYHTLGW